MLSILLACGLRRAELSGLNIEDIRIRQGHWAIVDLVGKGNHVRTVPMPIWVKDAVDRWLTVASIRRDEYSGSEPTRYGLGNGNLGKRRLVSSQALFSASITRSPSPSWPQATMRKALPCKRRRTGANTVPVGARLGSNYRASPRLQAELGRACQRPLRLPVLRRCRIGEETRREIRQPCDQKTELCLTRNGSFPYDLQGRLTPN
jgi:hypothetical protein